MKYLIKKHGEREICYHASWGWVVWKPTTYKTLVEAESVVASKVIEGTWLTEDVVITKVGNYN